MKKEITNKTSFEVREDCEFRPNTYNIEYDSSEKTFSLKFAKYNSVDDSLFVHSNTIIKEDDFKVIFNSILLDFNFSISK